MNIVIIDYGAGNTKSVFYAFSRLGVNVKISADIELIQKADGVVFPGVGHASQAMKKLSDEGLGLVIKQLKQPVLGICLGMQLLAEYSEEGSQNGLGVIQGKIKRFNGDLKVPQIGWNLLKMSDNPLFEGMGESAYMYFVHSYYLPLCKESIGTAEYESEFSAAIQKSNYYGCQFHPEKSGEAGAKILSNFLKICELYQQ